MFSTAASVISSGDPALNRDANTQATGVTDVAKQEAWDTVRAARGV